MAFQELVRLLAVAGPMGKLQVLQIAGVSASGYRNNMVDTGRQWVRIAKGFVHGFAADTANSLGRHNLLFVPLKSQAVGAVFIWTTAFRLWHISHLPSILIVPLYNGS